MVLVAERKGTLMVRSNLPEDTVIRLDEAHAKLRPRQVGWIHTALAMGSWFWLWVDVGLCP